MEKVLQTINSAIWGLPLLLLILCVGVLLSVKTKFAQFTLFPKAVKNFIKGKDKRKELFTALAATVGTGNLAGVAGAITIGGPGAVFWMWVCGFIGMITKFAEATLAVYYRKKAEDGEYVGGPMYIISSALPSNAHWLATVYCFFGAIAAFGVGNATQINAAIGSIQSALNSVDIHTGYSFQISLGAVFSVLIFLGLWNGESNIGKIAEKLVPFASISYLLIGCGVLALNYHQILPTFKLIFAGAFSPGAVTGGVVGSAFITLRTGAARGVFTNEAGMGTAGIAHAGANVKHPVEQGMMGIVEVFIDTIVICTMTALVIFCSGVPIPYGSDAGVHLTSLAFSAIYGPWASAIMAIMVCCFAVATVFGWSLYGGRCIQFLFGAKSWRIFVVLQAVMVIVSAVMKTGTAWILAEIVNGLMAVPNLILLIWLSPKVVQLYHEYKMLNKKFSRLS